VGQRLGPLSKASTPNSAFVRSTLWTERLIVIEALVITSIAIV
jgi:hypothetical protein